MMNDTLPAPAPRKARIEIIPLIDVVFFLLATFVLFTLSLEKIKAIPVPLPSGGIVGQGPDETVYLQASEAGAFYWKVGRDGEAETLTASELLPRLQSYAQSSPNPRVFVRGDGKAKFGSTVYALDQVRLAGIKQVSVETLVSKTGR